MLEVEDAIRWEIHTALALKSFLCGWDRNEANSHSKKKKKKRCKITSFSRITYIQAIMQTDSTKQGWPREAEE